MKIAIIFVSKYGSTEKIVNLILNKLNFFDLTLINLGENNNPEINNFDVIILGTPIYAGNPIKKMKVFCEKNINNLKNKKLGLFICGMEPNPETHRHSFTKTFPTELLEIALSKQFLGGEFIFEKMNFFEKAIIKQISKVNKSISDIKENNINIFVEEMLKNEN
jgi:menaquinone-dependent protoporphyrinogen oxidase